jgi:sugar phosphate isomerase/epimerase
MNNFNPLIYLERIKAMKFSAASWSFHRLLEAGKQDMFRYIEDCKSLGMTQLDPWNGHLEPLVEEDRHLKQHDPEMTDISAESKHYIGQVKAKAEEIGLPFGGLAVDGPHIYWETEEERRASRFSAYRWLLIGNMLGVGQMRIDAGGPEDMPDHVFEIIVEGYQNLLRRAGDYGIELVIENHWGPSQHPANLAKILAAVDGLGLLFDTNNWAEGTREAAWKQFAPKARSVHIKAFEFDEQGNDPTVDLAKAIKLLVMAGYDDAWGIESVPRDGDEYNGVKKTKALIERVLREITQ